MADNQWTGLDQALKRMKLLPNELRKKGFKKAANKAMGVVAKAARQNAKRIDDPDTAAAIHENIAIRMGTKRDERRYGGDVVVSKVGVLGGAKAQTATQTFRDTKRNQKRGVVGQEYSVVHWRHVELGTRHARAQPFMRPALEDNQSLVITKFSSALGPEIDKALQKLGGTT